MVASLEYTNLIVRARQGPTKAFTSPIIQRVANRVVIKNTVNYVHPLKVMVGLKKISKPFNQLGLKDYSRLNNTANLT